MAEVKLIYIVDDEPVQSMMLQDYLSKYKNFEIKTFRSGEEVIGALKVKVPQIIFLDYYFDQVGPDAMNGTEILKEIKSNHPDVELIMFSGQDKIEVAVNTMKYGAFDYIVKNESAFHRSENVIFNIIKKLKVQGEAKRYKKLTAFFGIAFAAMIILVIVLWRMGMISRSPGWM